MNRQLLATLFSWTMILLCAFQEQAIAQTFTWSKAGSRPQDYDMGGDPTVSRGSANAGFIKSKVTPINGFGTYLTSFAPGQYRNQAVRLSAYVKTVNVGTSVVLWMRVNAGSQTLSFDNMGTRPIVGTTDWAQYESILDVPENSTAIVFGILLNNTGEAYVDGLKLEPAARTWFVQNTGISQQIFSIKAVDENVVWAGADQGVYLRTTDGGLTWKSGTVPGAETFFFNSIAAIDQNTAYFTAVLFSPGWTRIYKTIDGGATWKLQYENTGANAYFNGIAFWDANHGLAVGDPVDGSFLIVTTTDGGATWNRVPSTNIPAPLVPEEFGGVGFDGGTPLAVAGNNNAWFGSGNASPLRVFRSTGQGRSWTVVNTPLTSTGTFFGITTVAFKDALNGFAGSFLEPYSKAANTLVKTTDGGQNWTAVSSFLPIT